MAAQQSQPTSLAAHTESLAREAADRDKYPDQTARLTHVNGPPGDERVLTVAELDSYLSASVHDFTGPDRAKFPGWRGVVVNRRLHEYSDRHERVQRPADLGLPEVSVLKVAVFSAALLVAAFALWHHGHQRARHHASVALVAGKVTSGDITHVHHITTHQGAVVLAALATGAVVVYGVARGAW